MTRVSQSNQEKIKEAILSCLYHSSPKAMFGAEIAREIIRDEEFVKRLLLDLEKRWLVVSVKKNSKGTDYIKRARWRLTNQAFKAYKDAVFPQI